MTQFNHDFLQVIEELPDGKIRVYKIVELCDLRDEQRAALAEISKRYNIGETK